MGRRGKEAIRSEDIARQREEVQTIGGQFLAQLTPGSPEFNELQAAISFHAQNVASPAAEQTIIRELGQQLVNQQQARIAGATGPVVRTATGELRALGPAEPIPPGATVVAAAGAAGPLEQRTNLQAQALRETTKRLPFEEDVFRILEGQAPTTEFGRRTVTGLSPTRLEEDLRLALEGLPTTTPVGDVFRRPLALAAQPPLGSGEPVNDTVFRNALKVVEDRVNAEAAGRGTLGGGLRLEQLGRAGTEAAIEEALRQDRLRAEQNRLRQEAYGNTIGLFDTARSIPIAQRDYLANIFNLGEGLRTRDIGLEEALTNLQLGRETNLTGLMNLNQNLRLQDLNQLLQRQTGQATADRLDALDAEAARRVMIGEGIGTAIGATIGTLVAPGVGTAIGGTIGGKIGGGIGGGGRTQTAQQTAPLDVSQFLASQRSSTTPSGTPAVPSLSRRPGQELNIAEFAELLRQLGTSGSSGDFASRLRAAGL